MQTNDIHFERGYKDYLDGVGQPQGAHHKDYINGWLRAELDSKCGFRQESWNRTVGLKTSERIDSLFI